MYDFFGIWGTFPKIPNDINMRPPTLYALLESIVNFGTDEKTKIKDLASVGRTTIFNFDYPLFHGIDRAEFETMILNKFIMRRIGYETVTAFQIALNVKLNEIMPTYNKLFEAMEYWRLFEDGEKIEREQNDTRNSKVDTTMQSNNTSNTTSQDIADLRESELPQSEIDNVKNASYLTKYNLNTNNANGTDVSEQHSTGNNQTAEAGNLKEIIKRSPANNIDVYTKFLTEKQNIYTMIFKDLDSLFYQLI